MSKVSRSVYQKVCEENKSLKKDIHTLVRAEDDINEYIEVFSKWDKKFRDEREFNAMMKLAAKEWIKNNPNDPAVKAYKEIKAKSNE